MRRWLRLLLFLGLLGFPQAGYANGLPVNVWWPSAFFVPNGATQVGVMSEELTYTFPADDYPRVTARYLLKNQSAQDETLTIAFLYLHNVHEMTATWMGEPLQVQRYEAPTPPSDWQAPEGFPSFASWESRWLDPGTGEVYAVMEVRRQGSSAALLPISIPAGGSGELVVSFIQGMTGCDKCKSNRRIEHYTYLLSPARYWASFGSLTIRVEAPVGLQIASEPSLRLEERTSGSQVLVGNFDTLPQGELHMSTRRRARIPDYFPGLTVVLLAAVGLVVWRVNRRP